MRQFNPILNQPRSVNGGYAYGLDLLRFAAALSVVLFHLTWLTPGISLTFPYGWVGVQIFFVISGVVIANSASSTSVRKFIVSRARRLYPAAWIAAAISGVVLFWVPPSEYLSVGIYTAFDATALVSSVLLFGPYGLYSAFWTLPVEVAFYAVVAVLLLVKGPAYLKPLGALLLLISAGYNGLCLLHAIGMISAPWLDLGYGLKNALLVRHGVYFALGLYVWSMQQGQFKVMDIPVFILGLATATIEITLRAASIAPVYAENVDVATLASGALGIFGIALGIIAISVMYSRRLVPPVPWQPAIRILGLMTYPLYLLHETIGGGIKMLLAQVLLSPLTVVLIGTVCAAIVAYMVAIWGEPSIRRAMDRRWLPR